MLSEKKVVRFGFVICLIVLVTVCLSGCSIFHEELLDSQVSQFISCVSSNRPDECFEMFYPGIITDKEAYYEKFAAIHEKWQSLSFEMLSMTGFKITETNKRSKVREKTYKGTYSFKYNDVRCLLTVSYLETSEAKGITSLEIEETSSSGALFIISIALTVLIFGFVIYTVYDIVRHKPKGYVLWIMVAVLLTLAIPIGNAKFGIPLGGIIYWCKRNSLYRKQEIQTNSSNSVKP